MKKQTSKFIEALEIESAKTTTDNGAEAYATTTNNNLDLFAVGSRDIEISSLVKPFPKKRKEYLVTIVLRHLGSWEGLYIFFGMIGATYFDNFSISNIYEKICSPGYSTPGSSNNYTQTGIQK
jgi:hypothetical protein